jgi:predicted dehydrogenase
MDERKVTGAVIGCGQISKLHLGCMKEAGYRIGAVCDVDLSRAEAAKAESGDERTLATASFEEALALSEVDVAAVCTPPAAHARQTVEALKAGKFVYCEKPVARTLDQFDAIFAAEAASGKRAYFTPGRFRGTEVPMIRQYVDDGDLGDVYRVEARHLRGRGRTGIDFAARWFADSSLALGGIMPDMGLYHMDRCFYLTGWPAAVAVSAVMFRAFPYEEQTGVVYDVEEHALLMVRTEGKLTFTFEFANISYYDSWPLNSLMMLGNKGGIHLTQGRHPEFRFLTEKGGPGRWIEHRIDWKDQRKADTVIYEELAAAVQGTGQVRMATTSRQALALHEVMAMAYLSSHLRREVRPEELDRSAQIFIKP